MFVKKQMGLSTKKTPEKSRENLNTSPHLSAKKSAKCPKSIPLLFSVQTQYFKNPTFFAPKARPHLGPSIKDVRS